MRCSLILGGLFLTGCVQFPQLENRLPEGALDAPFPQLVPLGAVQPPAARPPQQGPSPDRIAALSARANALRGPVLTPADRARLQAGVNSRGL